MPLFTDIKNNAQLTDQTSFVALVLKRLAISEIIAATRFKVSSPLETEREIDVPAKLKLKCQTLPEETSAKALDIFKAIISIASLIQNAWKMQHQNTPVKTVQANALALAQDITGLAITPDNLLALVRRYSSDLTDQIIEKLSTPHEIQQLDLIEPMLIAAFPQIDGIKLKAELTIISDSIEWLTYEVIETEKIASPWSCVIS